MPSVRKLTSSILPKIGSDLTIFGTSGSLGSSQYGTVLSVLPDSPVEYAVLLENDGLQSFSSEDPESCDGMDISPPTRKRQRLDHLSQEEKVMRRKLKNRVAAQSARDRKKARMTELEEQVVELEEQKRLLWTENSKLRNKNAKLQGENAELKLRLGLGSSESVVVKKNTLGTKLPTRVVEADPGDEEESSSIGHASLISDPLQKEQDLHLLTLWMMQFVYLPAIVNLMTFLLCYNSVVKNCCNAILVQAFVKVEKPESSNQPMPKWWGPQQKAWNPSKN